MQLAEPLRSKDYILSYWHGQGVHVKPMWEDNPKAPVANYFGGQGGATGLGAKGSAFAVENGWLGGKMYCRWVLLRAGHGKRTVC